MTASANPRCRLAPRTSSQECVPTMQNSFKTSFNSNIESASQTNLLHQSRFLREALPMLTSGYSGAMLDAGLIDHRFETKKGDSG
jgi:hypothetical protein